ncbi:MAG: sigma-54 dependent transcriptional regulator [Candidatus Eisenbacteria bacterium]|nr:sigma-54 dependent transcriptional regulator [Candidatus Eisenbacteria bacterium]
MNRPIFPSLPILLIDDEAQALQSFRITLYAGGINNILACQDSSKAIAMIASQEMELILLDLWMPKMSGEEILVSVTRDFPDIPVIIITGANEVETAVRCMRFGAFDYLVKPVEKNRLITTVNCAIELSELRRENNMLRTRILSSGLEYPEAFFETVTQNEAMKSIFQYVEAIARTSQPVLITGETGVGKELIAKSTHTLSRREGVFVPVNVAGLDDNVFADTLFGHKKGAFTGADEARSGMIEQAQRGTLFLDEIGDLSPSSQVKLLRLLQEREYFPLGSDLPQHTDSRIIVATNQNIHALLKSGKIRQDIYYRLRTHHVHIPPLRERLSDLPLLIDHFLKEAAKALGKKAPTAPKELLTLLGTYNFPGNIRELRAMIFDAVSSHKSGILSLVHFKKAIGRETDSANDVTKEPSRIEEGASVVFPEELPTLKKAEEQLLAEALKRSGNNQGIAARLLGISRQALNRRLRAK